MTHLAIFLTLFIGSLSAYSNKDIFPIEYVSYQNQLQSVENTNFSMKFESKQKLPSWVNLDALYVGFGTLKYGDAEYNNLVDGATMVQRFSIRGSNDDLDHVEYYRRILETETYKANTEANNITFTEPFTYGEPADLLDGLDNSNPRDFAKIAIKRALNFGLNPSDNTNTKLYSMNKQMWAFSEYPYINVLNRETLEVITRLNIREAINRRKHKHLKNFIIINQVPHAYIDEKTGDFYNACTGFRVLGRDRTFLKPAHLVYKIPGLAAKGNKYTSSTKERDLKNVFKNIEWSEELLGDIESDFATFGWFHDPVHTENYLIYPLQSLEVSIPVLITNIMKGKPLFYENSFAWNPKRNGIFLVVDKKTLKQAGQFAMKNFITAHSINAYERENQGKKEIVYDFMRFFNSTPFDALTIKYLNVTGPELIANTENYSFKSKAWRVILDMSLPEDQRSRENPGRLRENLGNVIELFPDNLSDNDQWQSFTYHGHEFPMVTRPDWGNQYETFYSCGQATLLTAGDRIYKGNVETKERAVWIEPGFMVSELVVASRPENYPIRSEFDKVKTVIGAYATPCSKEDVPDGTEARPFYVILDGEDLNELARAYAPVGEHLPISFHMSWDDWNDVYEPVETTTADGRDEISTTDSAIEPEFTSSADTTAETIQTENPTTDSSSSSVAVHSLLVIVNLIYFSNKN